MGSTTHWHRTGTWAFCVIVCMRITTRWYRVGARAFRDVVCMRSTTLRLSANQFGSGWNEDEKWEKAREQKKKEQILVEYGSYLSARNQHVLRSVLNTLTTVEPRCNGSKNNGNTSITDNKSQTLQAFIHFFLIGHKGNPPMVGPPAPEYWS